MTIHIENGTIFTDYDDPTDYEKKHSLELSNNGLALLYRIVGDARFSSDPSEAGLLTSWMMTIKRMAEEAKND